MAPINLYPQKAPQKFPKMCVKSDAFPQADVPRQAIGLFPHNVQALLTISMLCPEVGESNCSSPLRDMS